MQDILICKQFKGNQFSETMLLYDYDFADLRMRQIEKKRKRINKNDTKHCKKGELMEMKSQNEEKVKS